MDAQRDVTGAVRNIAGMFPCHRLDPPRRIVPAPKENCNRDGRMAQLRVSIRLTKPSHTGPHGQCRVTRIPPPAVMHGGIRDSRAGH